MFEFVIKRTPSDELMHFGIKGQKWGIRRFQNEDGTRTKAGLIRERENSSEDPYKPYSGKNKKYVTEEGLMTDRGMMKYQNSMRTAQGKKVSVKQMVMNAGNMNRTASYLKNTLMVIPGAGELIGAGAAAIGSLAVDSLHNLRIDKAKKFVARYNEAYENTRALHEQMSGMEG